MPDDDLTLAQRSVLMILMAEAREVPNAYLTNDLKFKLEKDLRDNLESRGLIRVQHKRRLVFMELTERGWRWCADRDWTDVPARPGHGGAAAHAILAGLRRNLPRLELSIQELFTRYDEPQDDEPVIDVVIAPTDVEMQIRKAYSELAARPGDWVKLVDLRRVIGDVPRPDVDRVLVELNRTSEVSIVPESNQKVLSEQDQSAAIQIGNQDKHLIAIGSS